MSQDSSSSSSSCSKTSNNKHFNCPPRMDDGRHFTDYRANCYTNNLIRSNNDVYSSYQMRMFLTQNATRIMDVNREEACDKNCCGPCQKPYQIGTTMPEQTASVTGTSVSCGDKVSQTPLVPSYSGRPLDCPAWNSGNANNKTTNCCTPLQNAAEYYPESVDDTVVVRKSIPGGGVPLSGGDPNMYH